MRAIRINTLGALIEHGYRITAFCDAPGCRHSVDLDLPALAEKLGADFVTVGNPNPLAAKLRCQTCGSKDISLIFAPPAVNHGFRR